MLGVGFKNTWNGVELPPGALAFLRASRHVQDRDHNASSPWGRVKTTDRVHDGWREQHAPSQSSEVTHLHSENRFLFVCLFFFPFLKMEVFFFIPFKFFKFFLKFYFKVWRRKKVCKQVGAQSTAPPKAVTTHVQVLVPAPCGTPILYKYLWPQFNNSFVFVFNFIFQMGNGAILW